MRCVALYAIYLLSASWLSFSVYDAARLSREMGSSPMVRFLLMRSEATTCSVSYAYGRSNASIYIDLGPLSQESYVLSTFWRIVLRGASTRLGNRTLAAISVNGRTSNVEIRYYPRKSTGKVFYEGMASLDTHPSGADI